MTSQKSINRLQEIFRRNRIELVIIRNTDDVFEFGYSYRELRLKGSYTMIGGLDGLYPDEWKDLEKTVNYVSRHKEYKN